MDDVFLINESKRRLNYKLEESRLALETRFLYLEEDTIVCKFGDWDGNNYWL